MAGAMRKMGVYLGLLEDTERFDDDYDEHDPEIREADRRPVRAVPTGSSAGSSAGSSLGSSAAPVAHLSEHRRASAAEMSRITTLHPRTYNEARTIGEHFREGIPVIMNLSEMDDNDAKRLVDFAAGLVFAVHGTIERVTSKVFLLSPPNVTVAAEDKQLIAEGGFFNQS
jgi:cell division inhibitor SepF